MRNVIISFHCFENQAVENVVNIEFKRVIHPYQVDLYQYGEVTELLSNKILCINGWTILIDKAGDPVKKKAPSVYVEEAFKFNEMLVLVLAESIFYYCFFICKKLNIVDAFCYTRNIFTDLIISLL